MKNKYERTDRIVMKDRRQLPARAFMTCPKCGEFNTRISNNGAWAVYAFKGRAKEWFCPACNHTWRIIELNHESSYRFLHLIQFAKEPQ